jgi:O-antigen/teichoic acid export membrane protein
MGESGPEATAEGPDGREAALTDASPGEVDLLRSDKAEETAFAPGTRRPASQSIVRNAVMNLLDFTAGLIQGFFWPPIMLAAFARQLAPDKAQDMLGVWDLGWGTVVSLKLLYLGTAASVNRFVARHRATGDWLMLNRSVSACGCLLAGSGIAAVVLTVVLTVLLPHNIDPSGHLYPYLDVTQWVVLFMGIMCGIEMFMSTYYGVITGCQRYDLTAWINITMIAVQLVTLVLVLRAGLDLRAVVVAMFGLKLLESFLIWRAAHRVCPTLRFQPASVRLHDLIQVGKFGAKTFVGNISDSVVTTATSWLLTGGVGLAPLAWLKRSTALIDNSRKGVFQITRMLAPVSSEAQALGAQGAVRRLALDSTRWSLLLSLPGMLALAILYQPLLRLWLGPAQWQFYSLPLLPILAAGNLIQLAVMGPRSVLLGLNKHGWMGVLNLIGGALTIAAIVCSLRVFHGGVLGVAIALAGAPALVTLVGMPIIMAWHTDFSIRKMGFLLIEAVLLALPFTAWLLLCRFGAAALDALTARFGRLGTTHLVETWNHHARLGDGMVILAALGGGAIILLATYWRRAVPEVIKAQIRRLWTKADKT